MRKARVKALTEALTTTRIHRGQEGEVAPERNELRRAKEAYNRARRGEPCGAEGRQDAAPVQWPEFANVPDRVRRRRKHRAMRRRAARFSGRFRRGVTRQFRESDTE